MAFSARASHQAFADINVTPLVDVMLVLLIIFMITVPILTHKARVDLPMPNAGDWPVPPPDPIQLTVAADGALSWNSTPISDAQLEPQLSILAHQAEQPELEIRAADGTAYEAVAHVLAAAKAQGVAKIDFVDSDG